MWDLSCLDMPSFIHSLTIPVLICCASLCFFDWWIFVIIYNSLGTKQQRLWWCRCWYLVMRCDPLCFNGRIFTIWRDRPSLLIQQGPYIHCTFLTLQILYWTQSMDLNHGLKDKLINWWSMFNSESFMNPLSKVVQNFYRNWEEHLF